MMDDHQCKHLELDAYTDGERIKRLQKGWDGKEFWLLKHQTGGTFSICYDCDVRGRYPGQKNSVVWPRSCRQNVCNVLGLSYRSRLSLQWEDSRTARCPGSLQGSWLSAGVTRNRVKEERDV